jgi:hypothetical protein
LQPWIRIWSFIDDKFYFPCSRLEYVNRAEKNIFRVKLLTYRGKNLVLSDGTCIHDNDLLLKIHLHNCVLMKEMEHIKNDTKRALYVYDRVKSSMPGLAHFLFNHPKKDRIKGIVGITVLSRGVHRLGFEVKEIPNLYYRRIKQLYMKPMFILCHPDKQIHWKQENLIPKYLMMSKEQIFNKYFQEV